MAENLKLASLTAELAAPESVSLQTAKPTVWLCCALAVLSAAGCLDIYREITALWEIWLADPLRSIGMLIPPASIVLTLRVWRRTGWEMRGTWWGLLVIGLSFLLSGLRRSFLLLGVAGEMTISFIPLTLPLYLYGSGVVLLFAGTRVWRRAWFPLGLLLLSQPVPGIANGLIDIPLQNISARVARSFATLICFAPTTPQLRLMFSPHFGMFIAPGCDGIRGAVTMGYVALIFGYLKRFSLRRWAAYVIGAVLLGYLFNFIRLCVLVLYYRAALGHPTFEGLAEQADYAIGSCLFLLAVLLFLWLARRKQENPAPAPDAPRIQVPSSPVSRVFIKCAAFTIVLLLAFLLPSSALEYRPQSVPDPVLLANRMPKHIGEFTLTRTWYEQLSGKPVEEDAAYSATGSDNIILGVWLAQLFPFHDSGPCWLARGLQPDILTKKTFHTAGGESLAIKTGFYSDGVTDSIVLDAYCSSVACSQFQIVDLNQRFGLLFLQPQIGKIAGPGQRPVSIMIRIDRLHSSAPKTVTYGLLSDEAQRFLAHLDPMGLSRAFQ